ncbi:peptidoglycan glycosyltransferase FtsI [Candidatus Schneideria nysicola]|uniref:peptidoglycan glycosyltransferase FtsI n=1 Tax=Candidatus Schneideria nysicola TaxID=1081631 RepID=UPI001CAA4C44|nr:peptidoglycan glycosyltransferase FtsI [Candidatus Schneideria nysicola]UAJ66182.1 peptidoglycan glycosyltransferase FtsI [Candidatus Schneideria nysicola]
MANLIRGFPYRKYNRRFIVLSSSIGLVLLGLILRISYLQIINPNPFIKQGDMRSIRVEYIPTPRGMIKDRIGRPLAISIPAYSIGIDPKKIDDLNQIINDDRWKALSAILAIPINQILERIQSNKNSRFIYLARQVNPTIGENISKLALPGVYLGQESKRYYPAGKVTAHIVGVTNIDHIGIEGIEKSFDHWLTGKPSKRIIRKDRLGQVIETISSIAGQEANQLTLSIDIRLQSLVYRELNHAVILNKAESGTAVLIDIDTGEILAMTNSPSYDPNNLNVANNIINNLRNRAVTDSFEPGSTIKPIVIMAALQCGIVNVNSVINTLPYSVNGYQIKDVVHHNELTLTEILKKSSNVGVSKLALSMPLSVLLNTYTLFGIGQKTNLGLTGESSGFYPQKRWSKIDRATFSYGYGLMVTPLQLARVYATIGSMGILRPLSIIRVDSPVPGKRIFSAKLVRTIINMMESISLPGEIGMKAAVTGYRVAIKTGTTKKVGPNGKYINKYIAYTAGIAPASRPRFALLIIINDPKAGPYYGGAVSAPVFSNIMRNVLRIMNIEPDAIKSKKIL